MSLVPSNTPRVYGKYSRSPVILIEGERTNLYTNSGAESGSPSAEIETSPGVYAKVEATQEDVLEGEWANKSTILDTSGQGGGHHYSMGKTIESDTNSFDSFVLSAWMKIALPASALISLDATLLTRLNDTTTYHWSGEGRRIYAIDGGTNGKWVKLVLYLPPLPDIVPEGAVFAGYHTRIGWRGSPLNQVGDVVYVDAIQMERGTFPSTYISTLDAPATRKADTYTLTAFPFHDGPKTLNIAGYFDAERPSGSKHYWWSHVGASYIRQDGNVMEFLIENLPFSVTIPETGWVAVTLRDDGTDTQVWVNGVLEGTVPASMRYHAAELYPPEDTEQYAFTYLAFGAAGMGIPFLNPYQAMDGIDAMHSDWLAELQWGMHGMTYPPPLVAGSIIPSGSSAYPSEALHPSDTLFPKEQ